MKFQFTSILLTALLQSAAAAHLRSGAAPIENSEPTADQENRNLESTNIFNLEEYARQYVESHPDEDGRIHKFVGLRYDQFGINFNGMEIAPISETATEPLSLDSIEIKNPSNTPQSFKISEKRSVENSFSSTISEGFTSKFEIKASVAFKAIAKVESSYSMETYFNSTKSESATETVEVAWEHELQAAPFSRYTAKIFQRRYTTQPKFTAFIEIDGEPSRFDGPVILAETTVEGGRPGGRFVPLKDIPGVQVTGDRTAVFHAQGHYGSVSGRGYQLEIECFDIDTNEPCGREGWALSDDGSQILQVDGSFVY